MRSRRHQELLEMHSGSTRERSPNSPDGDRRVELAAYRLAVDFTEDADLPHRFRKHSSSGKPKKTKEDSQVEKRFRAKVSSWRQLIEIMLGKINNRQAWRFIDVSPEIGQTVQRVTDCKDFCDFMDYLVLRRDREQCGPDELGGLALLSTAFQREIDRRIQSQQAGQRAEPAGAGDA